MSLINQALKKEQLKRSQTTDRTDVPIEHATAATYHRKRDGKNTLILFGVIAFGLFMLIGAGTFLYFGSKLVDFGTSVAESKEAPRASAPNTAPIEEPEPAAQETPVQTTDSPAAEPPAVVEPEAQPIDLFDPKIQDIVDNMEIQGIRSAGDKTRLLMNSRVYKTGDIIDRTNNLAFNSVEDGKIVIEDSNGVLYRKNH